MNKKIVVGGITGLRNRGVDALLRTVIQELNGAGIKSVSVHTHSPEFDHRFLKNDNVKFLAENLTKYFRTKFRRRLFRPVQSLLLAIRSQVSDIRNSDGYIFSGGDLLSSEYEASICGYLAGVEIAQGFKKKTFIIGQSLGPYKKESTRKYVKKIFGDATYVSVREPLSYDYLTKDLGLKNVRLTPDSAFLLDAKSVDSSFYFSNSKTNVAIGLSDSISVFGADNREAHVEKLKSLIGTLVTNNCQVILLPHVQEIYKYSDDRLLAYEILEDLQSGSVRIVNEYYDSAQFKYLLSKCQLVFAERMHVGVGAIGMGVPTIFVRYSIKGEGMANFVYQDKELVDKFLVDVKELDSFDEGRLKECLSMAPYVRNVVRDNVVVIREQCEKAFQEIILKI